MTIPQSTKDILESRLQEMEEENELLLLQLHRVQEELETYYLRSLELEKGQPTAGAGPVQGWVDDELPDALAENQRLRALVDLLKRIHDLESRNALNAKLGNILIQGVDSPSSMFSVPGKIGKIWRDSRRQVPPKALGGKSFEKVIATYRDGGFEAVEKLLSGASVSQSMKANALTALARHLMDSDRAKAAEAARRAHALDPRPYRLKWLAFRLHEAGELIEAEAILDILPPDAQFSDSEERQANQLRYEAKQARRREAKQQTRFSEKRANIERLVNNLAKERDAQSKLAQERGREIEGLKQAQAKLEQEKSAVTGRNEETANLADARGREIAVLKEAKAKLEQEKSALEGKNEETAKLAEAQGREIAALKHAQAKLGQEKSALEGRHAETAKLAEAWGRETEGLKQAQAKLEQEKSALEGKNEETAKLADAQGREIAARKHAQAKLEQEKSELEGRHAETAKLAEAWGREIERLKQAQAKLDQENSALARRQEEAAKLAEAWGREIEGLKQAQAKLELEKSTLAERHEETAKLAEARSREIEGLKQGQANLEREKLELAACQQEQEKLAIERLKQLNDLQQQIKGRQLEEQELTARQRLMQEELARAEAQIDLIKDMLFREPGV